MSTLAVATWQWDPGSQRVFLGGAVAALIGLPDDAECDTIEAYLDHVHRDDRDRLLRSIDTALVSGTDIQIDHRVVAGEGQTHWFSLVGRVIRDGEGRALGAAGAVLDITSRIEPDGLHHWLRAIIEATPDVVGTADEDGRMLYLNRAGRRLLGVEPSRLADAEASEFYPGWAAKLLEEEAIPMARRDGLWQGESAILSSDGKEIPVSQVLVAHKSPTGSFTYSTIVRDISDRYQREEQLRHLAEHDALTGLRNRVALMDHLRVAVAASRRGSPGALIYLDVDQFTAVNDTLGHFEGDRLLVMVAERLQAALHPDDVLARLGGDEFGVLLRDVDEDDALAIAERMRAAVGELRFNRAGHSFAITASVGVAVTAAARQEGEVLAGADLACFSAKSRGRNRVVMYQPGAEEEASLSSDARWSSMLRDALARGRLRLLYQPVVDLTDGTVKRFEVLSRMLGEGGGLIPPGRFIPAAERFGVVGELDHWVLRRAVEQIEAAKRRGERLPLAINLSGRAFEDERVLERLVFEVGAANLEPGALSFEITETAAVINLPRARRFIQELHEIGCPFALDDFGSGFSSFAYLRHLPVDSVKIDGSFVRDLVTDPTNQALVRSMVEVAQATGKITIAECVEDETVLDLVKELGVDQAQGWHLGVPVADPTSLGMVVSQAGTA
ncbi:MAG: putative bifunctional diguanylate cyclase/phosphodiesterase [Actinomycetota bacterium]